MCDMRNFFFLDWMVAMCLIPLNSSRIRCIVVSLGPSVFSDALVDPFADLFQLLFLSFLSLFLCSSMVAFTSSSFCPLFAVFSSSSFFIAFRSTSVFCEVPAACPFFIDASCDCAAACYFCIESLCAFAAAASFVSFAAADSFSGGSFCNFAAVASSSFCIVSPCESAAADSFFTCATGAASKDDRPSRWVLPARFTGDAFFLSLSVWESLVFATGIVNCVTTDLWSLSILIVCLSVSAVSHASADNRSGHALAQPTFPHLIIGRHATGAMQCTQPANKKLTRKSLD